MHVIVYCEYEGPSRVLWVGSQGVLEMADQIRRRIKRNVEYVDSKVLSQPPDCHPVVEYETRERWIQEKADTWRELGLFHWEALQDPDRVSIMTGEEFDFTKWSEW